MNNQSVIMNISKDGREKTKIKAKDSLIGQGLRKNMRKITWHCKRDLMQLETNTSHNSNIEVLVLVGWSVQHVARNTLREVFHRIMVVGIRYIVHMRHKLLGMLAREFLLYM